MLLISQKALKQRLIKISVQGVGSVSEMTERLNITQSGISQHLNILKSNGILDYDKKAQTIIYKIKDDRIIQVMTLLKDLYCKEKEELWKLEKNWLLKSQGVHKITYVNQ